MASTALGSALTESHRRLQARLSLTTTQQLMRSWSLLDPTNLDRTVERWLEVNLRIVAQQRAASEAIARSYQRRFRAAELGTGAAAITIATAEATPMAAATTSIVAQGPIRLKALMSTGQPLAELTRSASATSAAAGTRHVLNAGREVIIATTNDDPDAYGARRVTSAGCCAFCAMLAARSIDGLSAPYFEAHTSCHCQPETAYTAGPDDATRQAQDFHALYRETSGDGGTNKLNAFRRALAAQQKA